MRRRDLSSLARSASQTLLDRIESNRRRPARVRPRDARETTTNRRMKMRARTASPHRRLARAFRRLARANSTDPRLASRSDESARARSIDRSRAVSSTRSGATKTVARVRRRGASRVRARACADDRRNGDDFVRSIVVPRRGRTHADESGPTLVWGGTHRWVVTRQSPTSGPRTIQPHSRPVE